MKNHGFKLLGIRPLEKCDSKYLKILREGHIYMFDQNYLIKQGEGYEEIKKIHEEPIDLYSNSDLHININAIVGKNGSGKSSIIELLFAGMYNLSWSLKLLSKFDEQRKYYEPERIVHFELYFTLEGAYRKILFDNENLEVYTYDENGINFSKSEILSDISELEDFFYTIVINYSHYALNSKDIGHWIKSIFHKNDAYQTPIVITPFRNNGNIDINTENYLVRSRLLAIVLGYNYNNKKSTTLLFNNRQPQKLKCEIDFNKFIKKSNGEVNLSKRHDLSHRILPDLFEIFFDDKNFIPDDNYINTLAIEYIINKLHSIISKYKHYFIYRNYYTKSAEEKRRAYFKALKDDKSHVTYKLRQAINFLRFDIFPEANEFEVSIDSIMDKINDTLTNNFNLSPIEIIPPSFFKIDIEFSDENDTFHKLSSGEKQKIFSTSSLLYHLKNLDSIHSNPNTEPTNTSRKLIRYKYVNVIFDEIELYYHPEYQRIFISDILSNIHASNFVGLKCINLLFVTHSPFILSDIPKRSVMFLEVQNGKTEQRDSNNQTTFGANIHDLLATGFFLNKGLMGEFAKQKIQEVINWCNNKDNFQNRHEIEKIINIIDEPILKTKLKEMYAQKTGKNVERARLISQREHINKRLNELDQND